MKLTELERVKSLLSQALGSTPQSSNTIIEEMRGHIRQAIIKLDKATKAQTNRKQKSNDQFEQWWNNVQSGTSKIATGTMSAEAQQKSLQQLNKLIAQEEQKMTELEKASHKSPNDELLTD